MTSLAIDLDTSNDSIVEGPERFRLDLANAQSTTGLTPTVSATSGSVTTTIVDNESLTWSLSGPASADEGSTPQFTVSLDGTAQAGEEISIDLGLTDLDANSDDYSDFVSAVQTAIAGRPDLAFNPATGTLTFTGTGAPMADLVIDLPITDDALTEGPEQFRVDLTNPASATGAGVLADPAADSVTTTINDTQGIGGGPDTANWSVTGASSADEGSTPAVHRFAQRDFAGGRRCDRAAWSAGHRHH